MGTRNPRWGCVGSGGRIALVAGLFLGVAADVRAQPTLLLSVDSAGHQANDVSDAPSVSEDGRQVAFTSQATNLVSGDTNTRQDVFVHDRSSGQTVRVNVDDSGVVADRDCENPAMSRDGRFVAFDSSATNLVAGDTNGVRDVFLHDRDVDENGTYDEPGGIRTIRVSVDSAGLERTRASSTPSVSADGRWVAFQANKSQGQSDILVYDAVAGTTHLLSANVLGTAGNGDSENPRLTASGRHLVFESNSDNLVGSDTNVEVDVFLLDRDSDEDGVFDESGGTTILRVSLASDGSQGDGASRFPAVSDDGRHVAFASAATNLVVSDTNGKRDVFVRDVSSGQTLLVSAGPGGVFGDAESTWPALSGDGRIVVFQSAATNLTLNDLNLYRDVFVFDRDIDGDGVFDEPGATELYLGSVATDGVQGDDDSGAVAPPVVSANGLFAAFGSGATNLVPGDSNAKRDVFGRFTSECGNEILTADEDCDDGNVVNGDGCDANCTFTGCGNGIPTDGEACDDGNAIEGDGCDSNCTFTGCGNGISTAGEECDDENFVDGDGCDSNCTLTRCGNGIPTAGEACDEGPGNGVDGCCSLDCSLIDFDVDEICDVDDLAELPADLLKVQVRGTKGDPERPSGSLVWKGALPSFAVAPYHSPAEMLAQVESAGVRAEIHATTAPPTTADEPLYVIEFAPDECTYGGPEGDRRKARCKKPTSFPGAPVVKLTLAARADSLKMKGSVKRADVAPPTQGPLRVVVGLQAVPPLEFEASLTDCVSKVGTRVTLKCRP